jgi:hypothetical protein
VVIHFVYALRIHFVYRQPTVLDNIPTGNHYHGPIYEELRLYLSILLSLASYLGTSPRRSYQYLKPFHCIWYTNVALRLHRLLVTQLDYSHWIIAIINRKLQRTSVDPYLQQV